MVKRRNTLLVTKRSLRNADGGSDKRPRRTVQPKVVDDTVGLSRREEQDLNKALYASLQDTRRSKSLPSLSNPCINANWRESPGTSSSKTDRVNLSRKRTLRGSTLSPKRVLRRSSSAVQSHSGVGGRAATLGLSRSHTNVSVDESSQDSVKSSSSSANGSKKKIHAQRKFAQGCSLPGTPTSGTPVKATSTPIKLLSRIPKTEDFLTFLCLRGTSVLPPHLDFFNFSREEIPHREEGSRSMGSSGKVKRRRESTPETSSSSSSGANEEIAEAGVSTPTSSKGSNLGQVKQSAARASAGTPDTARGIVSLRQGLQRKVSSSASSSSQSSSPCVCSSPSHLLSTAGHAHYPVKYRNKFYFTPEKSPSPSKASGILPGEFTPPRPTCAGFRYVDKSSPSVCQPTSSKLSPLAYPSSPQCLPRRSSSSSSSLSSSASGVARRKRWSSLFSSAGGDQVNPEPSVSGESRGVERCCTVIDAPSSLILSATSSPQSSSTSFPSHGAPAAFSSTSSTLCLSSFPSFLCSQAASHPSCRVFHGLHCLTDPSCCPRHISAVSSDNFIPTTSSSCSPCSHSYSSSSLSHTASSSNSKVSLAPCNVASASPHVSRCEQPHSPCSHVSASNPANAYCTNQTQLVPKRLCSSTATSVHDFSCSNQHDHCFCTQNPFCENLMDVKQCCPDGESETELFVSSEDAVIQDDDTVDCDIYYVENDIDDDVNSHSLGCVSTADGYGCSEEKSWYKGLDNESDNKNYENFSVLAEAKTADDDEKEGASVEEVEATDEEEKCPLEYMTLSRKKKKKKKKKKMHGMSMSKRWKKEMRQRKLGVSKKYSLVQEVPKLRIRIVQKNCHDIGTREKNLSMDVGRPSPADFQQEFVKMLQSGQFCTVTTDEPQENVRAGKESYNYSDIPTDHSQLEEKQAYSGDNISEAVEEKMSGEFLKSNNEFYDTTYDPHSSPEVLEERLTSEVASVESVQESKGSTSEKQGKNMKSVYTAAGEGKNKSSKRKDQNGESDTDLKSQNKGSNSEQPSKLSDSIILRDKVISAFAKFNRRENIVGNMQVEKESKKREDELSHSFPREQGPWLNSVERENEKEMSSEMRERKGKTFPCSCSEEKTALPIASTVCERKDSARVDKEGTHNLSTDFSESSDQNAKKSAPGVSNQERDDRLSAGHGEWGESRFTTNSVADVSGSNRTACVVQQKFLQPSCMRCMLKNEETNKKKENGDVEDGGSRHSTAFIENSENLGDSLNGSKLRTEVILSSQVVQTSSERENLVLQSHSHKAHEDEEALNVSRTDDHQETKEKPMSFRRRVIKERERSDAATQVCFMHEEMCSSLASGDENLVFLQTDKATQTRDSVKENSHVEKAIKGKALNQGGKDLSQKATIEHDFTKLEGETLMDTSAQSFTEKELPLEAHKRKQSNVNKEQLAPKQRSEMLFNPGRIPRSDTRDCCAGNQTTAKFPEGSATNVDSKQFRKKKNKRHAWEVFASSEKSASSEERETISSETSFSQTPETQTVARSSGNSSCDYHMKNGADSSSKANQIMVVSETKATQSHPQTVVSNCPCYSSSTSNINKGCKQSCEKSFLANSPSQHFEISQSGAVKCEKLKKDSSSQTESSEQLVGHVVQAGSEASKVVPQHTALCLQSAVPASQLSSSLHVQSCTSKRTKCFEDSRISFLRKDLNPNMASFVRKDVSSSAAQSVEKNPNSSAVRTGSEEETIQTNEDAGDFLHMRDASDMESDLSDEIILLDNDNMENDVFIRGSGDRIDQWDSHVYGSGNVEEFVIDLSLPGSSISSSDSCSSTSSVLSNSSSDSNTNSSDSQDSFGGSQPQKNRGTLGVAVLMKHQKLFTHKDSTLSDQSLHQVFMSKESAAVLGHDPVGGHGKRRDCSKSKTPRAHKERKGCESTSPAFASHQHAPGCKRRQEPQTSGNSLSGESERRQRTASKTQHDSTIPRQSETFRRSYLDQVDQGSQLRSVSLNKQPPADIVLHSYGSLNTGQGYALINGSLQKCEILNKRECPWKESSHPAEDGITEENYHKNQSAGIVFCKKTEVESEVRVQKKEVCVKMEEKSAEDNAQNETSVPGESSISRSSVYSGSSNSKSLDSSKDSGPQPYPSAQLRIGESIYLKDRDVRKFVNQKNDTEPTEKQRAKTHKKSNQAQAPVHSVWGHSSTFQTIKKDQEVRPVDYSQFKVRPTHSQRSSSDLSALVPSVPCVGLGEEQRGDLFPASHDHVIPTNSQDSFTKNVLQAPSRADETVPLQVGKPKVKEATKTRRSKSNKSSKKKNGSRDLKLDETLPWPRCAPEQGKDRIKKQESLATRVQQYCQVESSDDYSSASQNTCTSRKSLSDWLATETGSKPVVQMHPKQVLFTNHGVLVTESAPLRNFEKSFAQSTGSVCDGSICEQPNHFSFSNSNSAWKPDKKIGEVKDFRLYQSECIIPETMSNEKSQIPCPKDMLYTSKNSVIPVEFPVSCVSQGSGMTSSGIDLQNVGKVRNQDTKPGTYSQSMNVQKTDGISSHLTYSLCPVPATPTYLLSAPAAPVKSLSHQSVSELPSSIQTTPSFSHSFITEASDSRTQRTENEIVGDGYTSSLSQSPLERTICQSGDGNVLDAIVEELKVQIAILKDEISQGNDSGALENAPANHTKLTSDKVHAPVGRGTMGQSVSSISSWEERKVENTWTTSWSRDPICSTSTNNVSTSCSVNSTYRSTGSNLQSFVPSLNEVGSANGELLFQGASGEWYEVHGPSDSSASHSFGSSSVVRTSNKLTCNIFPDDGGDYIEISDNEDSN